VKLINNKVPLRNIEKNEKNVNVYYSNRMIRRNIEKDEKLKKICERLLQYSNNLIRREKDRFISHFSFFMGSGIRIRDPG
jgi:hypothetical protein